MSPHRADEDVSSALGRLTLLAVWNRASVWDLLPSLVAFLAFMVILPTALGFGVGTVELVIWLAAVAVGLHLIVRGTATRAKSAHRPY
jgi:hypothetical protein